MKRIILPAIIALVIVGGSSAMSMRFTDTNAVYYNHNPIRLIRSEAPGDSLFTLDELKNNLALTQDQIPIVDSILNSASAKLNSVTDPGVTGQQDKQRIINDAYMAIENILTSDQRAKFDSMKNQSQSTAY